LLDAANEASVALRDRFPGLRLELVCGMSIDPAPLAARAKPGVSVRGYLRNLEELFVASDAAAVQSGLTTTTECLMIGLPTMVVPLANHWEQENTARYAQEVANVERVSADTVTPESLAAGLTRLLERGGRPALPFRGDGHIQAARLIHEALVAAPVT
jgi:predicted glycosyltransferase